MAEKKTLLNSPSKLAFCHLDISMNLNIKIGTRGSKLALWQAYYVQELLQKAGAQTEIVTIETKGDKVLDVSIAKIGSKGVFTEEIEEQLKEGHIDIAVHSAKDMPSELPAGFDLIAFTEREQVQDVLISHQKDLRLANKEQKIKLGTSSTRRIAVLRQHYPHIETVEVRGNLQTRIRKMEEGLCDGLLLAYAGVHRMGYDEMIVEHLSTESFTPAVGQGSVAIEVYKSISSEKLKLVRTAINHPETETRLLAERAYLKKLQGGCSIPAFALATWQGTEILLNAGIISLDGRREVRKQAQASPDKASWLGEMLANEVLKNGGAEILKEIKGL